MPGPLGITEITWNSGNVGAAGNIRTTGKFWNHRECWELQGTLEILGPLGMLELLELRGTWGITVTSGDAEARWGNWDPLEMLGILGLCSWDRAVSVW